MADRHLTAASADPEGIRPGRLRTGEIAVPRRPVRVHAVPFPSHRTGPRGPGALEGGGGRRVRCHLRALPV